MFLCAFFHSCVFIWLHFFVNAFECCFHVCWLYCLFFHCICHSNWCCFAMLFCCCWNLKGNWLCFLWFCLLFAYILGCNFVFFCIYLILTWNASDFELKHYYYFIWLLIAFTNCVFTCFFALMQFYLVAFLCECAPMLFLCLLIVLLVFCCPCHSN